jgi:hypothetical protein
MKKIIIISVLLTLLVSSAYSQESTTAIQGQNYVAQMDSMATILDTLSSLPSEELFLSYKTNLVEFAKVNEKNYSREYSVIYQKYSHYYFFMISQKVKYMNQK